MYGSAAIKINNTCLYLISVLRLFRVF